MDRVRRHIVRGQVRDESRCYLRGVIEKLGTRGCNAVVLGRTEIPLSISESDSLLPAIDSTRTLARAAPREARSREKESSS